MIAVTRLPISEIARELGAAFTRKMDFDVLMWGVGLDGLLDGHTCPGCDRYYKYTGWWRRHLWLHPDCVQAAWRLYGH